MEKVLYEVEYDNKRYFIIAEAIKGSILFSCKYRSIKKEHPWDNVNVSRIINFASLVIQPNFFEKLLGITLDQKINRELEKTKKWLRKNFGEQDTAKEALEKIGGN